MLLTGFNKEIVTIVYGRGEFTQQDILITAKVLMFYSIGLIFYGYRDVISYAFYAKQNTIVPMKNAAIAVIINIILNFILSRFMGIAGLALATSISGIVCSILMWRSLKKLLDINKDVVFIKNLTKILIITIFMFFVVSFSLNILSTNFEKSLNTLISFIIGFIFYGYSLYIFNIEECRKKINLIVKELILKIFRK